MFTAAAITALFDRIVCKDTENSRYIITQIEFSNAISNTLAYIIKMFRFSLNNTTDNDDSVWFFLFVQLTCCKGKLNSVSPELAK